MNCFRQLLINHSDRTGALVKAISCGRTEMIQLLLHDGEKVDKSCLIAAAGSFQNDILRWIFDSGIASDLNPSDFQSALDEAFHVRNRAGAEFIISVSKVTPSKKIHSLCIPR